MTTFTINVVNADNLIVLVRTFSQDTTKITWNINCLALEALSILESEPFLPYGYWEAIIMSETGIQITAFDKREYEIWIILKK